MEKIIDLSRIFPKHLEIKYYGWGITGLSRIQVIELIRLAKLGAQTEERDKKISSEIGRHYAENGITPGKIELIENPTNDGGIK